MKMRGKRMVKEGSNAYIGKDDWERKQEEWKETREGMKTKYKLLEKIKEKIDRRG